jgi:hypothetical protein
MKLIKLTLFNSKTPIYINVEMIGSLNEVEEKDFNRKPKKYTSVGHITHNNGGFKVIESIKEIAKLIINSGNGLANIIKE